MAQAVVNCWGTEGFLYLIPGAKDLAGGDDSEKSDVDSALEEGISLIAEASARFPKISKAFESIQHNSLLCFLFVYSFWRSVSCTVLSSKLRT